MKKRAAFIKCIGSMQGDARLYRLSSPMEWSAERGGKPQETKYVVLSKIVSFWDDTRETLIFPADGNGKVLSKRDIPGGARGSVSHKAVLEKAGYEVTDTKEPCRQLGTHLN